MYIRYSQFTLLSLSVAICSSCITYSPHSTSSSIPNDTKALSPPYPAEMMCLWNKNAEMEYTNHILYTGASIQTYRICLNPPHEDGGRDPIMVHYWVTPDYLESKSHVQTIQNTGMDVKCQDFAGYKIEARYDERIPRDKKNKRCFTWQNVERF